MSDHQNDPLGVRPLTDSERAEHWPTGDPFEKLAMGYRRLPDSPGWIGNWIYDPPS